jgi:hypothetical protein
MRPVRRPKQVEQILFETDNAEYQGDCVGRKWQMLKADG